MYQFDAELDALTKPVAGSTAARSVPELTFQFRTTRSEGEQTTGVDRQASCWLFHEVVRAE